MVGTGGTGNLELGVKYRFINDGKSGFSAGNFPGTILPPPNHSPGEKTRLLLPLWLEKDFAGGTSLFGGYEFNPGIGNQDFWQAAIALTHDLSKTGSVGSELAWQRSDQIGGTDQFRAGIGGNLKLSERYSLLVSGRPTWAEHRTGYHFYAALGLDL